MVLTCLNMKVLEEFFLAWLNFKLSLFCSSDLFEKKVLQWILFFIESWCQKTFVVILIIIPKSAFLVWDSKELFWVWNCSLCFRLTLLLLISCGKSQVWSLWNVLVLFCNLVIFWSFNFRFRHWNLVLFLIGWLFLFDDIIFVFWIA